jgi:hypothetical protein
MENSKLIRRPRSSSDTTGRVEEINAVATVTTPAAQTSAYVTSVPIFSRCGIRGRAWRVALEQFQRQEKPGRETGHADVLRDGWRKNPAWVFQVAAVRQDAKRSFMPKWPGDNEPCQTAKYKQDDDSENRRPMVNDRLPFSKLISIAPGSSAGAKSGKSSGDNGGNSFWASFIPASYPIHAQTAR